MKLFEKIEDVFYNAKNNYLDEGTFDIFKSKFGEFKILKCRRLYGSIYGILVDTGKKKIIIDQGIVDGVRAEICISDFIHETCEDRKIFRKFGFEPLNFFQYKLNDFLASIERSHYLDYTDFIHDESKNWVNDENAIEVTFYLKGKELCYCWSEDLRKTLKEFCTLNYLDMNQTIRDKLILEGA